MKKLLVAALSAAFLPSCLLVSSEDRYPGVEFSTMVATQFNHRGMPNIDNEVIDAKLNTSLPAKWQTDENQATWFLAAEGWMPLSNDAGDAWFPSGHGGEFVEIDLTAGYSETFGKLTFDAGITSYAIPNGLEFITESPAFEERGETKEIFARVGYDVWRGVTPFLEGHQDVDETEGFYGEIGVRKGFVLQDDLTAVARIAAGWSDPDHAAWVYGEAPGYDSAFVVLLTDVQADYQFDKDTQIFLKVQNTQILDSTQEDWFDTIGVDSDNTWAGLGVRWSY